MGDKNKSWGMNKPPIMGDGDYDSWKNDMDIWQQVTDVPKDKQALFVHLSLKGKMKKASTELGPEILGKENCQY